MAITTSEARRDLFGLIERVNLDHSEVEITSRRAAPAVSRSARPSDPGITTTRVVPYSVPEGNDMAITTSEARRDLFGLIERVNLDHSEVEITSRR
ncbi:hypothetical protein CTI14_62120, partial [Methylobacterium radiotolerans]